MITEEELEIFIEEFIEEAQNSAFSFVGANNGKSNNDTY